MPALWQSSQRPMYVRTVWVDGFRHAILSHDDPYFLKLNARKRRPNSSATCTSNAKLTTRTRTRSSRLSYTADTGNCFTKFNFVVRNDRSFTNKHLDSSQKPDIEKLNLTDVDQESEDEFMVKANSQPLNEFDSCRSKLDSVNINMRTLKSNRTARSDVKDNTELSERVLQWLDLAGKVDLLPTDNVERMSLPRHSWPEIQRRNQLTKSRTAIDVRAKESGKTPSPKSGDRHESGTIERHGVYVPTVPTVPTCADTIESYARQSRNTRSTPRNETAAKTKDNRNKTKPKDPRSNIHETRQKVASERNAVEKQYAELISKKLIPDLKANKRQVHIFMPELPKKVPSNTTSRTESLLSQFSQLTQKSTK